MADNEGVRRTGEAIVVSTTPDVCQTPMGSALVSVPYPIMSRFDSVILERTDVRMTGLGVITAKSRITYVVGDEAGTGGGIQSGVNVGFCRPISFSSTVRSHGEQVVYNGSEMWMNCAGPEDGGNTKGRVIYVKAESSTRIDASGEILGETNPQVVPETSTDRAFWQKASPWVHGVLDVAGLVPGFGEVADGANALIYLGEGDLVGAGLSAAAMIPVAGWAATGGKVARRVGKELLEEGVERAGKELLEEGVERTEREIIEDGLEHSPTVRPRETLDGADPNTLRRQDVGGRSEGADGVRVSGRRGRYGHLQDPDGVEPGKDFSAQQKQQILDENRRRNGGAVKSDLDDSTLSQPERSQRGVVPRSDEWQVDHIVPKSAGGTNSYSNAQVLSRHQNRQKSNR